MPRARVAAAPPAVPAEAPHSDPGERPGLVQVTAHTWVRRRAGWSYWVPALAGVLGLTALVATRTEPSVESALTRHVHAALHRHHLDQVRVEVQGRTVILRVPTGVRPARATQAAAAVEGVGSVEAVTVYASRAEARACRSLGDDLDRVTRGQRIPFVGDTTTLTPAGAGMVGKAARLLRACAPARVVVGGHSDSSTVDGPTLSLRRAEVLARLLAKAGVKRDRLTLRGYGDEFPVSRAAGPSARQANQRGSIEVMA